MAAAKEWLGEPSSWLVGVGPPFCSWRWNGAGGEARYVQYCLGAACVGGQVQKRLRLYGNRLKSLKQHWGGGQANIFDTGASFFFVDEEWLDGHRRRTDI